MTAPTNLDDLRAHITAKLGRAVADRHSGWRTPVLATSGPQARVVVLRHASEAGRVLEIHTDRRSEKISAITGHPEVELCFWDQRSSEQLRARGTAKIETNGAHVDQIWAALPVGSRLPYLAPSSMGAATPGAVVDAPDLRSNPRMTKDQTEAGRDVFAVITIIVDLWDWLEIGSGGQRRARFRFPKPSEDGAVQADWIAP
jgi:pyridoxine/pyridoxamine 5'-phosphate oxidase